MNESVESLLIKAQQLQNQQQHAQAIAVLDTLLSQHPKQALAIRLKGFSLLCLKQLQPAFEHYQALLSHNPSDIDALMQTARIYLEKRAPRKALEQLGRVLNMQPNFIPAINTSAVAFTQLGQLLDAGTCYQQSLKLQSNQPEILINYGCVLYDLHDYSGALSCFETLLSLNPKHFLGLSYKAFVLTNLDRHAEAMQFYERARAINPSHAITEFNQSLCRLALGDYENGWLQHEWRWQSEMIHKQRFFTQPLWLGQTDIRSKTILIHAEQGLGDSLQFVRYVPKVAALGAHVIMEIQPELFELFQQIEGVKFIRQNDPLPHFDVHCPLMSLPVVFKTKINTIPAETPYLTASPSLKATWAERLGYTQQKRIGFTWRGNPKNRTNHRRSMPLKQLLSIYDEQYEWICLQKDLTEEELILLQQYGVREFSTHLTDFNQTAALIDQLDYVIATDSAVAHLTAAMNKPLYLFLARNADWRWLLDRHDSPWYPSVKLFRQTEFGDWEIPLAHIRKTLSINKESLSLE